MSLRQSTLAHVIDNFEEIRDSANIEHAINAVLKRFKDQDTANESYLYGLARDFLDGQPKRAATTSRGSIPKRLMLAKERKKALEELAFNPQNEKDAREWVEALIAVRQGQPEFRRMLLDAYDSRCAISGCDCSYALEAAHIRPYKGKHTNHIQNGILLRADLHTLFDLRKITISSGYKVEVCKELKSTAYKEFHGKLLSLPKEEKKWPRFSDGL